MGIIQRQATKASIVGYAGVLLGFLTTIYLLPYFLTPEQIGVYRFIFDTGLLLGQIATLGMPNIVIKFFPYFRNDKTNHNGFILFVFFVPLLGAVLMIFLIMIFKDIFIQYFSKTTSGYDQYFAFLLPLIILNSLFISFESFSAVNKRIVVPRLIRDIIIRTFIILIFFTFFLNLINFKAAIKILPLVYFIALISVVIYIRILGHKIFPFKNFKLIEKNMARKMLLFGGFIVIAGLGSGLVNKIDIFVISSELGFAATGIYTTALYIAIFIEIPSRSIYQIAVPIITEAFKRNDFKSIEEIYKKTTQNLIIISGIIFLLLIVNVDYIFNFIPKGDIFSKGKYVLIFIALAKFIDTSIGLNFSILGYSKYYYYTMFLILLLGISNFFLNYWFISIWGITGSAVATLGVLIINNIITVIIVYWKYKIHPFRKKNIFQLFILLLAFLFSQYLINFDNIYLNILLKSSFVVLFIAFFTIKYNLSDDMVALYNKYLLMIKTKFKR